MTYTPQQNNPMAISVKNYSLKNPSQLIKIVSGSSFLYLIQSSEADY